MSLFLLLGLFAHAAMARGASESLEPDGAVPESPAFTFLGTTPSKVPTPGSTRDLGLSILQGVDENGRAQQGFALDIVPYSYLPSIDVSLEDYRHDWLQYALSNLQLSLGTVKSDGDTASTDIALGLRTTLLDRSDPLLSDDYTTGATALLLRSGPGAPHSDPRTIQQSLDKAFKEYREDWQKKHWGGFRLSVGGAGGIRAVRSEWNERKSLGWAGWVSGSGSLTSLLGRGAKKQGPTRGYWTAILEYEQRDTLPGQTEKKEFSYGARTVLGSPLRYVFLDVIGHQRDKGAPGLDRSTGEWSGGVEFKLTEGLWASTGFGSTFATLDKPDRIVLIANLRWALNAKSRIKKLDEAGSP